MFCIYSSYHMHALYQLILVDSCVKSNVEYDFLTFDFILIQQFCNSSLKNRTYMYYGIRFVYVPLHDLCVNI